jgi:hypothetical protein
MNTTQTTKLFTVQNTFHGRTAQFRGRADATSWEAWGEASESVRNRLRRELCGADKGNCTCGIVREPRAE